MYITDFDQIPFQDTHRVKQLRQIYAVLYYMTVEKMDRVKAIHKAVKDFPSVQDYQTIEDKLGRKFAGNIASFTNFVETGTLLDEMIARGIIGNDYDRNIFDELLSQSKIEADVSAEGNSNFVELVSYVLDNYPEARRNEKYPGGGTLFSIVTRRLPEMLISALPARHQSNNGLSASGSVGTGEWACIPWVAIMDKSITASVAKGSYVVFLFSADGSSVYLTLNQGTGGINKATVGDEQRNVREDYFSKIKVLPSGFLEGPMAPNALNGDKNSRAMSYETACIYWKRYSRGSLRKMSNDSVLLQDVFAILDIYINSQVPESETGEKRKSDSPQFIAYTKQDAIKSFFLEENELDTIMERVRAKLNLVLQGSPGVGKTFIANRIANILIGRIDRKQVLMVQFHQSYSYEDFVQGFRPNSDGSFELKNGIFIDFCEVAAKNLSEPYVLIIDEINRGNLSRIFGELMLLIESDKRSHEYAVPLTYQNIANERFHVPPNIYLIGTMNTADRSLAMVDYALRRRFSFITLWPKFQSPKFQALLLSSGVSESITKRIVTRMTVLNSIISEDTKNLGPGYQIGHSYFCPANKNESYDERWYQSIVRTEIAPLLEEYWFDNPEKAQSQIEQLVQ